MGVKCGIVGLPNVGKSTLFNALTSAKALAANYPFATKDPNIGIITVPDPRLDKIADIAEPQKIIPTTVEILDIAGLIKGASKGEGLGNQFLANIREVDAILHVVRCFDDGNIIHVDGSVNPIRDKETIDYELIFKDIETLEKRMDKINKMAKTGDKVMKKQAETCQALKDHLESGQPARTFETDKDGQELIDSMMLLTSKPVMYVCNVDEESVHEDNQYVKEFKAAIANENAGIITISANIEAQIAAMDSKEDRKEFLEMVGLTEPGVNLVIREAYDLLDLQTYFTAGEKEVRAWTVPIGATAPQAAGVIHTDFEKGFIRAEVIGYDDFITHGSEQAVKEAGKLAIEGKEYIVKDGDVIHFRFNV